MNRINLKTKIKTFLFIITIIGLILEPLIFLNNLKKSSKDAYDFNKKTLVEAWISEYESFLKKEAFYNRYKLIFWYLEQLGFYNKDYYYDKIHFLDLTYDLIFKNYDLSPYLDKVLRFKPNLKTIIKYQPKSYDIICSEFDNILKYERPFDSMNLSILNILKAHQKGSWEGIISSENPIYNTNINISSAQLDCLKSRYGREVMKCFDNNNYKPGIFYDYQAEILCLNYFLLNGKNSSKYLWEILNYRIKDEIKTIRIFKEKHLKKLKSVSTLLVYCLYELAYYFKSKSIPILRQCLRINKLKPLDREYINYLIKCVKNNEDPVSPYSYCRIISKNR